MRDTLHEYDRDINRMIKFINWLIKGQDIHGLSPLRCYGITPEVAEQIYNVNFGD